MTYAHPTRLRSVIDPEPMPQNGFTLIEVMIVVAIVAILAAVALPSYNDYVRRGQLPEAFTALSDFRVKMEQYYQDNRSYGTANCADVATPFWATSTPTLTYGAARYFTYTCALNDTGSGITQGYIVTATGSSGQVVGYDYQVSHQRAQMTSKFKNVAVAKNCFLSRGSEC
ncbi:type IV pilin protein [Piscinibacter sp.]|jgi:type IV pilus assembly protein PilE|uniref:type IV pilin protein n=1 Tax=Piscinibacter sp. TaxID=1903157 RepID=UPI003559F155